MIFEMRIKKLIITNLTKTLMKKLIVICFALTIGGAVAAQTKTETNPAVKKETTSTAGVKEEKTIKEEHHSKFECPKCHMTSDKPGKCSMCKVEMIEAKGEMKKEKAEMKGEEHKEHHGKGDGSGHGEGHGHEKKAEPKK